MGRRGPAPKPTARRLLEGNAGKRPLNRREPQPLPGVPPMPAWLAASARPWWPRVIAELAPMHVLTHADVFAVADICVVRSQLQEAAKGKQTPQKMRLTAMLTRVLLTLYNRFGLTPADRARLVANPKEEADPLDELRARRMRKANGGAE